MQWAVVSAPFSLIEDKIPGIFISEIEQEVAECFNIGESGCNFAAKLAWFGVAACVRHYI